MAAFRLLLALLLWKVLSVRADVDDACLTPGAARCDPPARVLSVCDEDGAWTQVEDCAAHGRVCFGGQCLDVNLTRPTETCIYEIDNISYRCSSDGSSVEICNSYGVWTTVENCSEGFFCEENAGTSQRRCELRSSSFLDENLKGTLPVICTKEGIYPAIPKNDGSQTCNEYYKCVATANGYLIPELITCPIGWEFNACTGSCTTPWVGVLCTEEYDLCGSEDSIHVVAQNPSLYYICSNGVVYWSRCPSGYHYNIPYATCVQGVSVICENDGNEGNSCSCPSTFCPNPNGSTCSFCYCTTVGCNILPCDNGYYYSQSDRRCILGSCN